MQRSGQPPPPLRPAAYAQAMNTQPTPTKRAQRAAADAAYCLAQLRAELAKYQPSRQQAEHWYTLADEYATRASEAATESDDAPAARAHSAAANDASRTAAEEFSARYFPPNYAPSLDTFSDADPGL